MSIHATLRPSFAGALVARGDRGYDDARSLLGACHDRSPALIAGCTGPQDVRAALAHAREHDLAVAVAVRDGGPALPGRADRDGGLVVDTGPMRSVEIDVRARTGRFGAGLTWEELDAATLEHGLACERLLSVELVTADGSVLRAGVDEHPELFWRLTGGADVAVVTEFTFRLLDRTHPPRRLS